MKICLISHSCIADDPRIRRHGDALTAAGHEVVGVGALGATRQPPAWPVIELPAPRRGGLERVARLPLARLGSAAALRLWWNTPDNKAWAEQGRSIVADVYVANDWPVLPLAARLAEMHGTRYVYDSHEYAVEEHAERAKWRLFYPAYISGIEHALAPGAAAVLTVSDGIAELLQRDLRLAQRPAVVRNVPHFESVDEHRLNDPLQILYQGRFAPDRGIETLLSSVRDWVPGRVLVLRGLGDAAYLERLRRLARPAGSTVRFDTPVDPGVLVSAASTADVGIHPIAGVTSQTALCLPNKFFEYVMAGLALCVSDVPEMRRVVEEHDLGWLIPEHSSTAIAATINAITPVDVSRFRANARSAAHALSWEIEGVRLIDAFGRIAS